MLIPKTHLVWLLAFAGLMAGAQPAPAQAPSRPNVLVILADDLGFSDLGCYGGEIKTPVLDGLAKNGLRYTQFYNTARCWPSRSALMSGYYPQQVRMDPPQKTPPTWLRLLSHHLRGAGYLCYHSGKWHIGVMPRILADAGFHKSYHLIDTDRFFTPAGHHRDDKPLPKPDKTAGYYATRSIADHAIECLQSHAKEHANEPFFQYLCFTSPHFPLQALEEDIARYRDQYLEGWEKARGERYKRMKAAGIVNCALPDWETPTPSLVYSPKKDLMILGENELAESPAWKDLTPEQKRFQATKMAIHAAMVDRMDREIGRVVEQLKAMKALDNTIILFMSDNGASAEVMVRGDGHNPEVAMGSLESFLCLGGGWASVANTPFRRFKIWLFEGGTSTPLIVHWPQGVAAKGELRHDVGHLIDIVPTLLEATGAKRIDTWNGVAAPPLPGKSLVPSFAKDRGDSRQLYFNHSGHRALRDGDWKVVFEKGGKGWELYNLANDRCEVKDLASEQPERLFNLTVSWQKLDNQWKRDSVLGGK